MTGDKFMLEWDLKQLWFTYSSCEPLTKHRERIPVIISPYYK